MSRRSHRANTVRSTDRGTGQRASCDEGSRQAISDRIEMNTFVMYALATSCPHDKRTHSALTAIAITTSALAASAIPRNAPPSESPRNVRPLNRHPHSVHPCIGRTRKHTSVLATRILATRILAAVALATCVLATCARNGPLERATERPSEPPPSHPPVGSRHNLSAPASQRAPSKSVRDIAMHDPATGALRRALFYPATIGLARVALLRSPLHERPCASRAQLYRHMRTSVCIV